MSLARMIKDDLVSKLKSGMLIKGACLGMSDEGYDRLLEETKKDGLLMIHDKYLGLPIKYGFEEEFVIFGPNEIPSPAFKPGELVRI